MFLDQRFWSAKSHFSLKYVMSSALWSSVQMKTYGSHVTKLCLPKSEMGLIISIHVVHKNVPAMVPGDLTGILLFHSSEKPQTNRKLENAR